MTDDGPHCSYVHHPGNVHEFVFEKATRQSLDEHWAKLGEIFAAYEGDDPVLMMFDLRPDSYPPVGHIFRHVGTFYKENPPPAPMFVAYLLNETMMISLIDRIMRNLRLNSQRKFFVNDQDQVAIDWLLSRCTPKPA